MLSILINDLFLQSRKGEISNFADNHTTYAIGLCLDEVLGDLENGISAALQRLIQNCTVVNPEYSN